MHPFKTFGNIFIPEAAAGNGIIKCNSPFVTMEEEPLLAGHEDGSHPDGISVHKLAAILAALRVGALPSSAQASAALQAALRSPLLQVDGTVWTPEIGHGRVGVGKLTKEGEQVRNCTRDVIESVLGWLGTRNSDDQLQDFVHACRNSKIDLREFRCWSVGRRARLSCVSC